MSWNDIILASGGAAGLVAVFAVFAKLVAEKSADAALKRFDHALRMSEKESDARLKRIEAEQASAAAFAGTLDVELRTARGKAYAALWLETARLPQWPRNVGLQYDDLVAFSGALRDWYFNTGGIYLSRSARPVYGTLQETVQDVLAAGKTGTVDPDDYERVRKACSALRTELTEDLLSRREAPTLGR